MNLDILDGGVGIFEGIVYFEVKGVKMGDVGLEEGDIDEGGIDIEREFDDLGLVGILVVNDKLFGLKLVHGGDGWRGESVLF